uniref:Uncharacterized protein n=1 Tax=Pinctada fucata TaxID=50426 RepID=A0A194AM29_PINFU
MSPNEKAIFITVMLSSIVASLAFPKFEVQNRATVPYSQRARRSSLIMRGMYKCAQFDELHSVCYLCGRTYDSLEIYTQCCQGQNDIVSFCETVVAR